MSPTEEQALITALLREHPEIHTAKEAAHTWAGHAHTWTATDGRAWWVDTTTARDPRPGLKVWQERPTAGQSPVVWIPWRRIAEVAHGVTSSQLAWF